MKNLITAILTVLLLSSYGTAEAQLLKRVLNRATDKIANKVEDKIVEGISEEIANRAMRPIDDWYEQVFREQYKATYGKEYDDSEYENDEERAAAMSAMMSSMFGSTEIADSYSFSHVMEVDMYDYGAKKPNKMKLLISTDSDIFGVKQESGDDQLIVWDFGKDVMVLFNEKEKTAMGMPSFMKMASKMAAHSVDQELSDENFTIEKTSKTKKILGYKAQKYEFSTDDETGEAFMTDEIGFSWKDSYGKMMKDLAPNFYRDNEVFAGNMMVLESVNKRKSDKKKSKWITRKIDDKGYKIKTSDYKVSNPMDAADK